MYLYASQFRNMGPGKYHKKKIMVYLFQIRVREYIVPNQRCVSWMSIVTLFVDVEIPAPWSSRRCAAPTAKLIPMNVLYDKKPAELEKLLILFTGENAAQVLTFLLLWRCLWCGANGFSKGC